jgi:hypothetical protein
MVFAQPTDPTLNRQGFSSVAEISQPAVAAPRAASTSNLFRVPSPEPAIAPGAPAAAIGSGSEQPSVAPSAHNHADTVPASGRPPSNDSQLPTIPGADDIAASASPPSTRNLSPQPTLIEASIFPARSSASLDDALFEFIQEPAAREVEGGEPSKKRKRDSGSNEEPQLTPAPLRASPVPTDPALTFGTVADMVMEEDGGDGGAAADGAPTIEDCVAAIFEDEDEVTGLRACRLCK